MAKILSEQECAKILRKIEKFIPLKNTTDGTAILKDITRQVPDLLFTVEAWRRVVEAAEGYIQLGAGTTTINELRVVIEAYRRAKREGK